MPTAQGAPADWTRVTVGGRFTIALPPDVTPRARTGVDTLVGEYASPAIELRYDYGKFVDRLSSYTTRADYHEASLTLSGHPARLVSFTDRDGSPDRPYVAAIHIADLKDNDRLSLYVRAKTPADIDTAKRIFHSISFP
jgi:hypothetical protein